MLCLFNCRQGIFVFKMENYVLEQLHLVLDNSVLEKYNQYYFKQHPRAKKKPIEHPYHPSLNVWMVLPRIQMNALKQKWKDFIVFWINDLGLQNKRCDDFEMTFTTYMPTRRRIDPDNTVEKFVLDGFTEAGLIVDDDGNHLKALTLKTGYDKDNPRTEIDILIRSTQE